MSLKVVNEIFEQTCSWPDFNSARTDRTKLAHRQSTKKEFALQNISKNFPEIWSMRENLLIGSYEFRAMCRKTTKSVDSTANENFLFENLTELS